MKKLLKFLRRINSWPEEARRLLIFGAVLAAGILLFSFWTNSVSSRLNRFNNPPRVTQNSSSPLEKIRSENPAPPGILESLGAGIRDGVTLLGEGTERMWKYIYKPLKK